MSYKSNLWVGFFFTLFSLNQALCADPDYDIEREQLIAQRLTERVKLGEPIQLKSGKYDVFALYTVHQIPEKKGAVVLLHGMAAHPDWPGVISQLRQSLPKKGWSTLSIQLPVLASEEPIEDYGKTTGEAGRRIKLAVKYLQEQGYEHVVVIGYSFGAALAVKYLAQENPGTLGLVGISMQAQPFLSPRLFLLKELGKIDIPILDIYGSLDRESIIDAATDRRLAVRNADNIYYKQIMIGGADHDYTNQEDILLKRILVWIDELVAKMKLTQDNGKDTKPAVSQ